MQNGYRARCGEVAGAAEISRRGAWRLADCLASESEALAVNHRVLSGRIFQPLSAPQRGPYGRWRPPRWPSWPGRVGCMSGLAVGVIVGSLCLV